MLHRLTVVGAGRSYCVGGWVQTCVKLSCHPAFTAPLGWWQGSPTWITNRGGSMYWWL